jgi:hypothetical protein
MSSVHLHRAIFSALPQLSEVQQIRLLEFIQSLLSTSKQPVAKKTKPVVMREIKVLADETFSLEEADFHVSLPFSKTFVVKVNVGAVEKLKPVIHLT